MRKLIPLLGLFVMVPSIADGVYKWTDEEGQMHFSDTPHAGAQEIDIAPPQSFSLPAPPVSTSSSSAPDETADTAGQAVYKSLEISSPSTEDTIWNTGGQVSVAINLQPGLQTGHRIRVYMDGQQQDLPPRTSSTQLTDVPRGEHQLRTEVRDENGKVLIRSEPVTFFYQQTSVNRR